MSYDKRTPIKGGYSHVHADDGKAWAHLDETVCLKGVPYRPHGSDDPSVEEWKRTLMDKPLDPKVFHGSDPVNLPPHYRVLPVECIDVTEHFTFCAGNAIKYLWRHQHKGKPIQDLEKAAWYINREIERLKREQ